MENHGRGLFFRQEKKEPETGKKYPDRSDKELLCRYLNILPLF